jgi:hypothetical protein
VVEARVEGDLRMMKVGDRFEIDVPVYRKWWQFWRPRIVGTKRESYILVSNGDFGHWPMRVV